MSGTKIEWTEKTWNPVTGCSKISQGCKNCYAERIFLYIYPERNFTDVKIHSGRLGKPLHWNKPQSIFVNSMSDLFHEDVPDEFIEYVFGTMALAQQHTFQVLTKRPERMLQWFTTLAGLESREVAVQRASEFKGKMVWDARGNNPDLYYRATAERVANRRVWPGWPLPNVWLGVSVEDQEAAEERVPLLLKTVSAVRFLSCEPLLGPIDLTKWEKGDLNWVIVGGESGPHARAMNLDWARSLRDQCRTVNIPFFFKQLSQKKKTNDYKNFDTFPDDLKIREYPRIL